MNLTDEQITRAFFEMILRNKEFNLDEENYAHLWTEDLEYAFNDFLEENDHKEEPASVEAFREYSKGGF